MDGPRFVGIIWLWVGICAGAFADEVLPLTGPLESEMRTLESLNRGMDWGSSQAACQPEPTPRTNALGLPVEEFRDRGFWYNEHAALIPPRTYSAQSLAISSSGCAQFRVGPALEPNWERARQRCAKTGYRAAHLHVGLSSDGLRAAAENIAISDPWYRDPRTRDRVFLVQTENLRDLRRSIADLAMNCMVADQVTISSHGSPDTVGIGPNGDKLQLTVDDFLNGALSPCLFSPAAHVQFTGCQLACGTKAESIRRDLEQTLASDQFTPSGGGAPFDSLRILLNSSMSFIGTEHRKTRMKLRNGTAILYSVSGKKIVMDPPRGKIPACEDLTPYRTKARPMHPGG